MPPSTSAGPPAKIPIDWKQYAEDARDLLIATSSAGPAAMRVWATAWLEWATCAARAHEQMALRWTDIVRDPGRGGNVLNKMREDFKEYLLKVGAIPERAVLEFLVGVTAAATPPESGASGAGGRVPDAASGEFVAAADRFMTHATDAFNRLATAEESRRRARGASAAAALDPVADLQRQLSGLRNAHLKLGRTDSPTAE